MELQSTETTPLEHGHTKRAALPVFFTRERIIFTVGGFFLGVAILFLILFFISKNSLPGQALYGFKTTVAEEAIALTKPTAAAKSTYAVTRFERRFNELQALATDMGTTSPEVLSIVADLTEKHGQTVTTALEQSTSLTPEEKITTLAKLQSLARAEETLVDTSNELTPISDRTSTTERQADESLQHAITTFASSSAPEVVSAFIATQITNVSEEVTHVANGSKAQTLTLQRISDAEEAIADGKLADALSYILKARQAIAVDGYLYSAERGPVDGHILEPMPMPEGS